ncbi:MAG: proline dehydrogenase family protein [Bacteroidetes bacterium]|nr:proline dehydrogenase family protein [Bacteroidota bacterium]
MSPLNNLIVSSLQVFPKGIVKRFALRYIAGEHIEDAVRLVRSLNSGKIMATIDVLGENVSDKKDAEKSSRAAQEVLKVIDENKLDTNLSIKLTQFGLNIDKDFCYANVKKVMDEARSYGNFVRIDMEDSSTTSATLGIYEKFRAEGYDNTGVVIQAYMRRSESDVRKLIDMKANVRLCKGIYIEPENIAFKGRDEIRQNYVRLLNMLLEGGCKVGIATHDEYLIKAAYDTIARLNIGRNNFEFQMLLGVRSDLRDKIFADGHRLRVYVPFGEQWYAYSMRRFKENPQVAGYIFKSVVFGK